MKRFLFAAISAALCFAPSAMAQADFTATAIMLTMMNMNQPGPKPEGDACDCAKVHKVAVVSVLGNAIPFEGSGKDGTISADEWNLNAQVTADLKKRLAGRFEFVEAPINAAALAGKARSTRDLRAYLKTLPNPGVDAYIVVRPVNALGERGIALSTGDRDGEAWLYANYEIDIIDAKSQSMSGWAESRLQLREPGEAGYAIVPLKGIQKAAVLAGTAPEATARIHRAVSWLLEVSIVDTLRALQTGAELPPIADHAIAEPYLAAEMAPYRKLAVVSAIGEDLRFVVGGHMFVDKKDVVLRGVLPGIDGQLEALASEVLARHHSVKASPIDRAALVNATIPATGNMAPIAGLPASDDIDAYVLFLKAPLGGDGGLSAGGIGATHWIPAGDNMFSVYANIGIAVIDAHTLSVVNTAALRPGPKDVCSQASPFIVHGMNCMIDEKKYAPKTPEALSDEAKAAIREAAHKILADAIPESLFAMGLDSAGPAETPAAAAPAPAPAADKGASE